MWDDVEIDWYCSLLGPSLIFSNYTNFLVDYYYEATTKLFLYEMSHSTIMYREIAISKNQ